jgi:hypothetical protein
MKAKATMQCFAECATSITSSRFGARQDGQATRNIMIDRILEDIVYRKFERSLFVQLSTVAPKLSFGKRIRFRRKRSVGSTSLFSFLSRS